MALFNSPYQPPTLTNVRAVEAGDAAEMVSRLQGAVAAALDAGENQLVDFNLAGAGSGPQWQAWLTLGESLDSVVVGIGTVQFVAAVAGSPEEALFYLKQRLTAAVGGAQATVYKVELAGAGDGPTYMAVAMFTAVIG